MTATGIDSHAHSVLSWWRRVVPASSIVRTLAADAVSNASASSRATCRPTRWWMPIPKPTCADGSVRKNVAVVGGPDRRAEPVATRSFRNARGPRILDSTARRVMPGRIGLQQLPWPTPAADWKSCQPVSAARSRCTTGPASRSFEGAFCCLGTKRSVRSRPGRRPARRSSTADGNGSGPQQQTFVPGASAVSQESRSSKPYSSRGRTQTRSPWGSRSARKAIDCRARPLWSNRQRTPSRVAWCSIGSSGVVRPVHATRPPGNGKRPRGRRTASTDARCCLQHRIHVRAGGPVR